MKKLLLITLAFIFTIAIGPASAFTLEGPWQMRDLGYVAREPTTTNGFILIPESSQTISLGSGVACVDTIRGRSYGTVALIGGKPHTIWWHYAVTDEQWRGDRSMYRVRAFPRVPGDPPRPQPTPGSLPRIRQKGPTRYDWDTDLGRGTQQVIIESDFADPATAWYEVIVARPEDLRHCGYTDEYGTSLHITNQRGNITFLVPAGVEQISVGRRVYRPGHRLYLRDGQTMIVSLYQELLPPEVIPAPAYRR